MTSSPTDYSNPLVNTTHTVMFQDYMTGEWIVLGRDSFCSVHMSGLGSPDLRTSELELPGADGIVFGREYLGSRKWTINGAIKGPVQVINGVPIYNQNVPTDAGASWNEMSKLLRAWDYHKARKNARDVVELYWERPGREAVLIYGRPERIDPEVTQAHSGYITYSASFRQSDPKFYSTVEQSRIVTINSPVNGGILMNSTKTALLAVNGKMQTSLVIKAPVFTTVGGDIPTSPIITFKGPVLNPSLTLINEYGGDEWTVKLETSLTANQSVTVDTRQWQRTTLRQDGASMAGYLRSPRLDEITLPLGTSELIYRGQDATQSSSCTIKYRNAWAAV